MMRYGRVLTGTSMKINNICCTAVSGKGFRADFAKYVWSERAELFSTRCTSQKYLNSSFSYPRATCEKNAEGKGLRRITESGRSIGSDSARKVNSVVLEYQRGNFGIRVYKSSWLKGRLKKNGKSKKVACVQCHESRGASRNEQWRVGARTMQANLACLFLSLSLSLFLSQV